MIHNFTWVRNNIQPILNNLGGEIFGGFVRDYLSGKETFNDVDINYPHPFSEENLQIFIKELKRLNLSHHISYQTGGVSRYDLNSIGITRTKIKLHSPDWTLNNELSIDLVWDHRGDNQLDVDLHALYMTPYWGLAVYPQLQYRFAEFNLKRKQFIALQAARYRISKLAPNWRRLNTCNRIINRTVNLEESTTDKFEATLFDEFDMCYQSPGLWEVRFPITYASENKQGDILEACISPLQNCSNLSPYRAIYAKKHSHNDEKLNLVLGDIKTLNCDFYFAQNGKWNFRECLVPRGVGTGVTSGISKLDLMQHDVYNVMEHPKGWS